MHQVKASLGIAVVIAITGLTTVPVAASNPGEGLATSTHPYVGSWMLSGDLDGDTNPLGRATISADGIARVSGDVLGIGAWTPTGPHSASLVYVRSQDDAVGLVTVRAAVEISDDGQRMSGVYAVTIPSPIVGGEVSPSEDIVLGSLSGERIIVGTPVRAGGPWECTLATRIC